jgi:spermidine synthase
VFFGALLAFAAGLSALIAETAWLPLVVGVVGADGTSIQAVLGAFFLGNAIGAWTLGRRAERRVAEGAASLGEFTKLLGGAAVGILLSLLAVPIGRFLIPRMSSGDASFGHTAISLAFASVVFAPAAIFLGGAFAVLGRGLLTRAPRTKDRRRSRLLAGLQGWNTAGAVAGALLATFGLLPVLGVRMTLAAAATVAGGAALLARILRRREEPAGQRAAPRGTEDAGGHRPMPASFLYAAAAAGAAAIFFEIVAIRVLTTAFDGTSSAFGTVVAAQLVGGACGAALGRIVSLPSSRLPTAFALAAVGLGLGAYGLGETGQLLEFFGATSPTGERAAEILTALILVAPAAALTAFLFVSILGIAADDPESLARVVSYSSAGAAAAPLLAGLLLLPVVGTPAPLLGGVAALGLGAVLTGLPSGHRNRSVWVVLRVPLVLSLLGLCVGWASKGPARLFPWVRSPDDRRIFVRDAVDGVIAVEESTTGARRLRTGSRFLDGGDESRFEERRQGCLPLLLHPSPQRVLVLGVGTGTTLGAVARDPDVTNVEAVELSGEVLTFLSLFSRANDRVLSRPNVHFRRADARAFVRGAAVSSSKFDVAVGDLFHPQRSGAGGLYTREHFAAIRAALAPGGLFVQWVPLHELPPDAFASLTATFLAVFEESEAFLAYFNPHGAVLGLVGANVATAGGSGAAPLIIDGDALIARLGAARMHDFLAGTLLDQPEELFGGFIADRAALARLAQGAPVATDDRPSIEHLAARSGGGQPFATLERVLDEGERTALPLKLPGAEGAAKLTAIERYRTAVLASLRGQIAQDRGDYVDARQFYQAGLAADSRFTVNRLQLEQLP